jgi:AdoMet-dependent rRNA methyltransferase SPB1
MTLAQQLVNRERTKTQLIDEGFNRHTSMSGGDGLPSWFLDDEQKHFRNNIPVTKEAVAAIREKLRALNARPIKKIAEAKARKKMRTIRRIEKTRAKAQGINDDEDSGLTEKEKASSIAKVLSKSASGSKPVKREIKLVVARGNNRGNQGRPKGVKGRYKVSLSDVPSRRDRAVTDGVGCRWSTRGSGRRRGLSSVSQRGTRREEDARRRTSRCTCSDVFVVEVSIAMDICSLPPSTCPLSALSSSMISSVTKLHYSPIKPC